MSREQQTNSKAADEAQLRKQVLVLERQVADLEAGLAMQASGGEKALITALSELRTRLEQLEKENREFANMYVEIQEQNEALTNLYVASQRLHAAPPERPQQPRHERSVREGGGGRLGDSGHAHDRGGSG